MRHSDSAKLMLSWVVSLKFAAIITANIEIISDIINKKGCLFIKWKDLHFLYVMQRNVSF